MPCDVQHRKIGGKYNASVIISLFLCTHPGSETVLKAQFTDKEVQNILTKITGLNLNKVFRPLIQQLTPPKYKLLTDTELEEVSFFLIL